MSQKLRGKLRGAQQINSPRARAHKGGNKKGQNHRTGLSKHTASHIAKVLRESSGVVAQAAARLGVERTTLYRYIGGNKRLQEIRAEADETVDDMAEAKLIGSIRAGDSWAVQFRLKTKGKGRGYSERTENNNVAVQVNLQVNDARDKLAHLIDSEATAIGETEGPLTIN